MSKIYNESTKSTLIHPNIITFFEVMVNTFEGHIFSVYKGSTTKTHAFQISLDTDKDERTKIVVPRSNGLFHEIDSRQIQPEGSPFRVIKAFSFLNALSWLYNDMRKSVPRGTTWPFNDWEFSYKSNLAPGTFWSDNPPVNAALAKRDLEKVLTGHIKKKPYFFLFRLYQDLFVLRYATQTNQDIL